MKKTLLLTIMCVFALFHNGNAQVTVEIGADKNLVGTNYYLPTYDYEKYSISQQIYLAEEFNDNFGEIKSVSFKLSKNVSSASARQYEVYMKQTDRVDLTGSYVQVTADDKVFDGNVTISGAKDTWLTITLDKAFDYADGNLMVCVYDKTGAVAGDNYSLFYQFSTDLTNRGMYNQGVNPFDMMNLQAGSVRTFVNQIKFEIEGKPIVVVEPETIDLGETMLGNYWEEAEPFEVSVKAVSTKVTKIETDNAFFVVPAGLDYSSNLIDFELAYDKNAAVDGVVNGNLIVTYEDGVVEVPVTANAYTPVKPDVYELAQEVTFDDKNSYKDTPDFTKLHDNYLLPRELEDGNAPDAVYAFELEEESLVLAKVTGENAKVTIYDETFSGKGGPSSDNNFKGSVVATSEFFYDFNDGFLIDWVVKNYDSDEYSWVNTSSYGDAGKQYGVDNTHCIISYSFSASPYIISANNVIMTERPYIITANSVLSFDAKTFGTDHLKVEVSKDGENYIFVKEIVTTTAYQPYEVDLGEEFANLDLEYGDYHIALRHQENDKMSLLVDNIRLSNSAKTRSVPTEDVIYAVPYPAGKYYLVASAEGQFSLELTKVDPEQLPLAPADLEAVAIDEFSIGLTWEAAENATSYNIYRNDEFLINVKDIAYTDENLKPNTDYCYIVKAYNDIMESQASEKACAKTIKLVLDYPKTVLAVAESSSSIRLSWNSVEKAAGYKIYEGEKEVAAVADTTCVIEGLEPGTEYCYSVSSFNGDVVSYNYDTPIFACATTKNIIPEVPVNVVATATSASTITLTWDAATNATAYNVYYDGELLKANVRVTRYNIINLEEDKEYCYTVSAVNGEEESAQCEPACATTLGDGIEEVTASFKIYPNPADDKVVIETAEMIEEVGIYSITGVMVYNVECRMNNVELNVDDLSNGVYFVKVRTGKGESAQCFIKK